jgi:hypothetical protein
VALLAHRYHADHSVIQVRHKDRLAVVCRVDGLLEPLAYGGPHAVVRTPRRDAGLQPGSQRQHRLTVL